MRVIWGNDSVLRRPTCVALGVFDGVHLGHRKVIGTAVSHARKGNMQAAVLTFDPHPDAVVNPRGAPPLLTTTEEKLALLRELGVQVVVIARFTSEMAHTPAEEFVRELLVCRLRARCVIIGEDWRFGARGAGTAALLAHLGKELGFGVTKVLGVKRDGEPVSSTRIRRLLLVGDVTGAETLLARRYSVSGLVVPGDKIGRKLGFPTANISVPEGKLLPADGIYAGLVQTGRAWPAVIYVGKRPTLKGKEARRIEVHLLARRGPIGQPGSRLEVEFVACLRKDRRFDSLEALQHQMQQDCDVARTALTGLHRG